MESSRKSPSIEAADVPLLAALEGCIARHVEPNERLTVGLSGGLDSVVLLHALHALAPRRLAALHINHRISPQAGRWEAFCRAYCASLAVPFEVVAVDVERGTRDGLESAARRARHAAYAAAATDWIVLAHQRDDQAETLLFNLLRGAGVAGAAGMRERNGRLLRPLLSIGREAIQGYAGRHRLEWCEDDSNADLRFSRNFLRQRVLPELRQRFPAASENLADAAARFAEAKQLLDGLAKADLATAAATFPVGVELLAGLDEARGRNVLRYLLSRSHVQIPSAARLREALRQMTAAGIDRHPAVSLGRHRLVRRKGWVYLEPESGGGESS